MLFGEHTEAAVWLKKWKSVVKHRLVQVIMWKKGSEAVRHWRALDLKLPPGEEQVTLNSEHPQGKHMPQNMRMCVWIYVSFQVIRCR